MGEPSKKKQKVPVSSEALRLWDKHTGKGAPGCFYCDPVGLDARFDIEKLSSLDWRSNEDVLSLICNKCEGSNEVRASLVREAENAAGILKWKCEGCAHHKVYWGKNEEGYDEVCCAYGYDRLARKSASPHGLKIYNQKEKELKYLRKEGWALDLDFTLIQEELHWSLLCGLCNGDKRNPWVNSGSVPSREGLPITCGPVCCELRPGRTDDLWAAPPSSSPLSSISDDEELEV